jgi:hypothetical protein
MGTFEEILAGLLLGVKTAGGLASVLTLGFNAEEQSQGGSRLCLRLGALEVVCCRPVACLAIRKGQSIDVPGYCGKGKEASVIAPLFLVP